MDSVLRIAIFILGLVISASTIFSAMETFVLPRSTQDYLTRFVFIGIRAIFSRLMKGTKTYKERDRILAFYSPVALLTLLPVWYILFLIGYMLMFWALGKISWVEAFRDSGSSLLTLGFASIQGLPQTILTFSEATLGLLLVALLIAYLPTIYSAFPGESRRLHYWKCVPGTRLRPWK